ncbi:MAG: V-type ATP synthase subunit F [Candidatus Hydrogenedentes bacterium]|nr:V-type ATP synthase subunit F [Candidatus Hydrogenedentota bacterium]
MSRAIAVGEKTFILGFKGVGFEIEPADNAEAVGTILGSLSRERNIGLVLLTETMAAENPEAVANFRETNPGAILTVIPTHKGSTRASFQEMRKTVERSIGVDMLGKD